MLGIIQKYFNPLLLTIVALLGLAMANLAAVTLGVYLRPSGDAELQLAGTEIPAPEQPSFKDFAIIRERNIFNSEARPDEQPSEQPEPRTARTAPAPSRRNLQLVGTVTAGEASLALLTINRGEIESYRLGEELPGGGAIVEITRSRIVIRNADGSEEVVPLYSDGVARPGPTTAAAPSPTRDTANDGIRPVGENRYVIARQAAEDARKNMPQLLRQARLEPNIVGGRTEGFEIKMLRPDSLLAKLGMRKGDVLVEVNGLELDSPEKGLQIFQQLREAKNIVVGLTRDGTPMSFTYEVN